jgi:hypothetical protein
LCGGLCWATIRRCYKIMADEPQTFEEAVSRFRNFLNENGYSADITWVESTDLVVSDGKRLIYVKLPAPARNAACALSRFERGMKEGRGVSFGTVCALANSTCCYAFVPKDEAEREQHFMGTGLKISARSGPYTPIGMIVTSRLRWWFLRFRHRGYSRIRESLFR